MRFIDTFGIRSAFDRRIPLADGTLLSADVYRPEAPGVYPVLVHLTPYGNNPATGIEDPGPSEGARPSATERYKRLAAHGYVVVAVDLRGRGDSEGDFRLFRDDAADGAEAIAWAAALPESDGQVGLFGTGYPGFSVLAAGAAGGAASIMAVAPLGRAEGVATRRGALRLDRLFWYRTLGGRGRQPVDLTDWDTVWAHRPIFDLPRALGHHDAGWAEWLAHGDDAPSVPELDLSEALASAHAPVLVVTGWWDPSLASSLDAWTSVGARAGSRLIIGPWDGYALRISARRTMGQDWGLDGLVDFEALALDWFEATLRGGDSHPRTRVFLTGRNTWLDEWAPAPAQTVLHLASNGAANTRLGDGRLQLRNSDGPADQFVFDPQAPLTWQPGRADFSRTNGPVPNFDSTHATARDDVLVYTSPEFAHATIISGSPELRMWAATDADDTDWVVVLEDVFRGGAQSLVLAHGVVRAGSTHGFVSDLAVEYRIPLHPICHEFQEGHSLRLWITSSLLPLYAVNGGESDYIGAVESRRQGQTVFHSIEHPSGLHVPFDRDPDWGVRG